MNISSNKNAEKSSNRNSPDTKAPDTKDKRCRWWAIEVYPESAVDNWQHLLTGYKWAMSPLHDRDTNEDGSTKKSHWHCVVYYPNKAYFHEVVELATAICGMKYVQPVKNLQGMLRYFAHLDNPEKHQYDVKDIKGFGGFDVSKYLITSTDIDELMRDIERYIRLNAVTEYADLVDISSDMHDDHPEWHKCITTHTIHFRAYIASKRHKPLITGAAVKDDSDDVSTLVSAALRD